MPEISNSLVGHDPIAIVSDSTQGGAAISCARLFHGLGKEQATWFAMRGEHSCGAVIGNAWLSLPVVVFQRLLLRCVASERRKRRGEDILANLTMERLVRQKNSRVINLHNLHGQMSAGFLRHLPRDIPLVWTLHDMWPLTGYCCYSFDCLKYVRGCEGGCPQLNQWETLVESPRRGWQRRQAFYQANARRLVFVSPSRWLAECARARLPESIRVEVIPYGLPLDVYCPIGEKQAVRQALGLPPEAEILLCGAQYVGDPRKGAKLLMEAVRMLESRRGKRVIVVAFGHRDPRGGLPEAWLSSGMLRDERLVNLYYNAADLFVAPSLADNLPNTLLEATAAGTPSVTFDVGGCPEVVRDGKTGFVARAGDAGDLARNIGTFLDMGIEQRQAMSVECRRVAEREYGLALQARRYCGLFDEISRARILPKSRS